MTLRKIPVETCGWLHMFVGFFVMMSVRKNGRIMYTMKKMKRAFPTIRF